MSLFHNAHLVLLLVAAVAALALGGAGWWWRRRRPSGAIAPPVAEGAGDPDGAAAPADPSPSELLDHLEQPVLLIGAAGTVTYANAAAGLLFGATEDLRDAHVSTLFEDAPELAAALSERRRSVTELALGSGAAAQRFAARVTPLYRDGGRFDGNLVTLVERTAARRSHEEDEGAAAAGRSEALMEALQEALRGALRGRPLMVLLDIVITGASRALAVPNAALYLPDAARDTLRRQVGVGGFEALEEPAQRRDEGLAGGVWSSGRSQVADALTSFARDRSGDARAWSGAAVGVPVRNRGEAVGVLVVARRLGDARAFAPDEVALLERFADLAAVAVHDAASRERRGQSELEMGWLDRIDALTARDAPDTEVLDAALRAANEASGFDRAVVWLRTEQGDALEARAWLGVPLGPEGGELVRLDGSVPLLEQVFRSGRELVLAHGGPLPDRYRPRGAAADAPLLRATRPVVLPLAGGEGVLGVLAVDDSREGVDLEARLQTLRRLAARAAQALERGRLRSAAGCLRERAHEAEADLEAAFEQREALIDALPAAYFETDLAGIVTRASRELARLAGAADQDLKGVRLADLSAPGAEGTLSELMGRVLRSGRPVRGAEWALRRARNGVLPVAISLAVLRDKEGAARGYFGVVLAPEE